MIEQLKGKIKAKVGGQLSKTIFKNSSLNAARTILLAILSFVTIPIILHKLGAENYGVWALVIAFASYSNFLELGFNSAVTKLVAAGGNEKLEVRPSNSAGRNSKFEKDSKNNNLKIKNLDSRLRGNEPAAVIRENLLEIRENPSEKMVERGGEEKKQENTAALMDIADQINSTVITYIFVSIVIFLFVLLLYPILKQVMFKNIFAPNLDLFILGTLFLNLANLVTSNYFSVLTGRMRMDVTNGIIIFTNFVQTALTIGMLLAGYGLMAVFAGSAAAGILNSVLPVIFAKREMPELFLSFREYSFSKIKHLFKFSLKMYFINSVSNFLTATNKFIIVRLTGLDFVAYYEIANKVVLQLRILFQNILEPVYPASSIVVSRDDEGQNKIVAAYNKAFKYLLLTSILGYGAMFVFSYPVFLLWLGKKYAQVSLITIIIGIGNFVNLQTAIPFFFLASLNRLQSALKSAIFVVACNFAFGLVGFYMFGFYGMIAGFSLALILPSIWFIFKGRAEVVG